MALPYRKFATYMLADLAERVKATDGDRVTLDGSHVSRQLVWPVRGQKETPEEFRIRKLNFRRDVPRGHDLSHRLAMAHEALVRAGEKSWNAAKLILENTPEQITSKIGTSRRSHRTKRKKTGLSRCEREIETIRTQARRYKRQQRDFDHGFSTEFGLYRAMFCRDAELCAMEEHMYRDLLIACEKDLPPWDELTATYTVNLARVLHEQGKYCEALPIYWLGLARSMAVNWAPHYRAVVLSSILKDIENCQNKCRPAFSVDQVIKGGHVKLYRLTVDLPGASQTE